MEKNKHFEYVDQSGSKVIDTRPRFPTVLERSGEYHTFLRKKHADGKFYLWHVVNVDLKDLMWNVWHALFLGVINLDMTIGPFEHPLFQLDPDQREEEQRLKDILNGGI